MSGTYLRQFLILVMSIRSAAFLIGEESVESKSWGIFIRNTSISTNPDFSKAADLAVSDSKDGETSYAINAALGIGYLWDKQSDINTLGLDNSTFLAVEYHRNNVIDKPTDLGLISLTHSIFPTVMDAGRPLDALKIGIQATVAFRDDRIKEQNAYSGTLTVTPFLGSIDLGQSGYHFNDAINFGWSPQVGMEYLRNTKYADTDDSSSVTRIFGKVAVVLQPFHFTSIEQVKRIELTGEAGLVTDVGRTGSAFDDNDRNADFYSTALSFQILPDPTMRVPDNVRVVEAKLALEFFDGENPTLSLSKQRFWSLKLGVKF